MQLNLSLRNAFKTRAQKIAEKLRTEGLTVEINGDKPRKGAFVISMVGQAPFLEMLNLTRPFAKLKALDIDSTASDILTAIEKL